MILKTETWRQDPGDPDLWHDGGGVIVNTAALEARRDYFEVVRQYALPTPSQSENAYFFALG